VVVSVDTVQQADFAVYLNGLGTVTPLKNVVVRSRVEGELVKVAFSEGQFVSEGDLLAEVDPRPFQIALQQAQGQLMRDEALLSNAKVDLERYLTLLSQDSISGQQTKTQEALVAQYQGVVEMDKAQVNNAKLQLTYAKIAAPISGRVGLRQLDQGNIIHTNDANGLVVITQMQPISVVFTLPEDKVQDVVERWHSGKIMSVEAFDRSGGKKLASGKLLAVDNQIDATTGTLKLKALFDNKDNALFANQFVNIKMHTQTLNNAIQVPGNAIQHDAQGAFVYAVSAEKNDKNDKNDRKVNIRRVSVGDEQNGKVVVLSGLDVSESVVTLGTDKLREGSIIDIAQKDGQAIAPNPDSPKPSGKFRKKDHS
jgi:multidrug efflux system membrane fusion protein